MNLASPVDLESRPAGEGSIPRSGVGRFLWKGALLNKCIDLFIRLLGKAKLHNLVQVCILDVKIVKIGPRQRRARIFVTISFQEPNYECITFGVRFS